MRQSDRENLTATPKDQVSLEVTGATDLGNYLNYERIEATIPLAAADSYQITLPPPEMWPGETRVVTAIRAAGYCVNGVVGVIGEGYTPTKMLETTGDCLVLRNAGGIKIIEDVAVGTPIA